jgi:hypothetical protein
MEIRKSVFGSLSEKNLFQSLQGRWSKEFDLYPSLPLSNIFKDSQGYLTAAELSFFYKTSVDYTLCKKDGTPILSIEFDGMGKGFSKDGKYVPVEITSDSNRIRKLGLKLRMAGLVKYPFFVISFDETRVIDPDLNLTIVDGIIGQVLAKNEMQVLIKRHMEEYKEQIESLTQASRHDYIQDLVSDAETLAELKYDPIANLASKMEFQAFERGIAKSYKVHYLSDPELPEGDPFDIKVLEARVKASENSTRVGCRVIIDTPKIAIMETVWLRNFEGIVSPLSIASNIAHLLAFKQANELLEKG